MQGAPFQAPKPLKRNASFVPLETATALGDRTRHRRTTAEHHRHDQKLATMIGDGEKTRDSVILAKRHVSWLSLSGLSLPSFALRSPFGRAQLDELSFALRHEDIAHPAYSGTIHSRLHPARPRWSPGYVLVASILAGSASRSHFVLAIFTKPG